MDNNGVVLGCLHEVRVDGVLQQSHHSTRNTEVVNGKWSIIVLNTKHNATDAHIQILDVACKAQDSHNLRCWRDVEACLCWNTICRATQA